MSLWRFLRGLLPAEAAAGVAPANRPAEHEGDVLKGWCFHATLQTRTPLRVLRRHGEIHPDPRIAPPVITREDWEGFWRPRTMTWREMGIDIPEFAPGGKAGAGEPGEDGEHLRFLIAVRTVVEDDEPVNERVVRLRTVLADRRHHVFVAREGGAERVVSQFFPLFLTTIPGLPETTSIALHVQGLNTAEALDAAGDEELLAFKGVGAAKLRAIRLRCAEMTRDRDAARLDRVRR